MNGVIRLLRNASLVADDINRGGSIELFTTEFDVTESQFGAVAARGHIHATKWSVRLHSPVRHVLSRRGADIAGSSTWSVRKKTLLDLRGRNLSVDHQTC